MIEQRESHSGSFVCESAPVQFDSFQSLDQFSLGGTLQRAVIAIGKNGTDPLHALAHGVASPSEATADIIRFPGVNAKYPTKKSTRKRHYGLAAGGYI